MKTTMHDKLLRLLRRKWMTPVSALEEAQCFSLAQRVSSWRAAGMKIDKKWVDLPSGKRVRAYRMVNEKL